MGKTAATTARISGRPARKTTTERIFGGKVTSHGCTDVPNLLLCAQQRLGISATQFNIITQLLSHWNDPSDPAAPSKRELARRMGITSQTLRINVADLEERGFVRREQQRTADGDCGPNLYHLDGLVEKLKELEPGFEAGRIRP